MNTSVKEVTSQRIYGFKPIVFKDSKVLILGTLPGRKSLEKGMYYADNGNYFWEFFKEYSGCLRPLNIDEATEIMRNTKVALWDVCESGIRVNKNEKKTSKDSDIRDETVNDIRGLLKNYPSIKRIGVLGGKGYELFVKHFPDIPAVRLASTSGSNGGKWGGKPIDKNKDAWKEWTSFLL